MFAALENNTQSHWNPAVHGLTCNVRRMFQEIDEGLYDQCKAEYDEAQVPPLSLKTHLIFILELRRYKC